MHLTIPEQIKKVRDSYNLSQERFGKRVGLSGKAISTYETGRCTPPLKVLKEISSAYGISFTNLNESSLNILNEKLSHLESAVESLKSILIEYEDLSL